jgi:hypothetical protein
VENEIEAQGLWATLIAWDGGYIVDHMTGPVTSDSFTFFLAKWMQDCALFPASGDSNQGLRGLVDRYHHLPAFKSMDTSTVRRLLNTSFPLASELFMAMYPTPATHLYIDELTHWLKKTERNSTALLALTKLNKMTLEEKTYLEMYQRLPQNLIQQHSQLVKKIGSAMGQTDAVMTALLSMIVLLAEESPAKQYYMKLLSFYVRDHATFKMKDDFLSTLSGLMPLLRELRHLRLLSIEDNSLILFG